MHSVKISCLILQAIYLHFNIYHFTVGDIATAIPQNHILRFSIITFTSKNSF